MPFKKKKTKVECPVRKMKKRRREQKHCFSEQMLVSLNTTKIR